MEKNRKWKLDLTYAKISYAVNRILLPPAKVMFVIWSMCSFYVTFGTNVHTPVQKITVISFGYFFYCGIANLIYSLNKKRVFEYKLKILEKHRERLSEIAQKSAIAQAKPRLDRANQLTRIINTTYDFEEFVNSYEELRSNVEFLKSIEDSSIFTGKKTSDDLQEITRKRMFTEKDFVDRYAKRYGTQSLEWKKAYFEKLLPETVLYIDSLSSKQPNQVTNLNQSPHCETKQELGSSIENNVELRDNVFDSMEGHDFGPFFADVLKKNGFDNIEVTQAGGDHGIDILAEKDGIAYAIQCKRYDKSVNNSAVQQAIAGKGIYK